MEDSLTIYEIDFAATIKESFDKLFAGETLGGTGSEEANNPTAGIDMAFEGRKESDTSVVVPEAR
jgi:hypothetical protein